MEEMEYNPNDVTIDITDVTEEVTEEEAIVAQEPTPEPPRNMFYAQDALGSPPPNLSKEERMRYNNIRRRVKKLRRLERSPLFQVQKMMMKENSDD